MALNNLKSLGGGTATKEPKPTSGNLSNLSSLLGEVPKEQLIKKVEASKSFIQKPGATTDEATRQRLLLEDRKKTEPWYKKAARFVLPEALEEKIGLNKPPTLAEDL